MSRVCSRQSEGRRQRRALGGVASLQFARNVDKTRAWSTLSGQSRIDIDVGDSVEWTLASGVPEGGVACAVRGLFLM